MFQQQLTTNGQINHYNGPEQNWSGRRPGESWSVSHLVCVYEFTDRDVDHGSGDIKKFRELVHTEALVRLWYVAHAHQEPPARTKEPLPIPLPAVSPGEPDVLDKQRHLLDWA